MVTEPWAIFAAGLLANFIIGGFGVWVGQKVHEQRIHQCERAVSRAHARIDNILLRDNA